MVSGIDWWYMILWILVRRCLLVWVMLFFSMMIDGLSRFMMVVSILFMLCLV